MELTLNGGQLEVCECSNSIKSRMVHASAVSRHLKAMRVSVVRDIGMFKMRRRSCSTSPIENISHQNKMKRLYGSGRRGHGDSMEVTMNYFHCLSHTINRMLACQLQREGEDLKSVRTQRIAIY